jgi:hypothetical protein
LKSCAPQHRSGVDFIANNEFFDYFEVSNGFARDHDSAVGSKLSFPSQSQASAAGIGSRMMPAPSNSNLSDFRSQVLKNPCPELAKAELINPATSEFTSRELERFYARKKFILKTRNAILYLLCNFFQCWRCNSRSYDRFQRAPFKRVFHAYVKMNVYRHPVA